LTFRTAPDGMIHGQFRLPPMMAAVLIAMIDALVMRWTPTVNKPNKNGVENASADTSPCPSRPHC
jgi:hypothetical protein